MPENKEKIMEECCTCISCKSQEWKIFKDRIECAKCGRETDFSAPDLHPKDLIHLTNDNF